MQGRDVRLVKVAGERGDGLVVVPDDRRRAVADDVRVRGSTGRADDPLVCTNAASPVGDVGEPARRQDLDELGVARRPVRLPCRKERSEPDPVAFRVVLAVGDQDPDRTSRSRTTPRRPPSVRSSSR